MSFQRSVSEISGKAFSTPKHSSTGSTLFNGLTPGNKENWHSNQSRFVASGWVLSCLLNRKGRFRTPSDLQPGRCKPHDSVVGPHVGAMTFQSFQYTPIHRFSQVFGVSSELCCHLRRSFFHGVLNVDRNVENNYGTSSEVSC